MKTGKIMCLENLALCGKVCRSFALWTVNVMARITEICWNVISVRSGINRRLGVWVWNVPSTSPSP